MLFLFLISNNFLAFFNKQNLGQNLPVYHFHDLWLFQDGRPYHIKTCPLIFSTNQSTTFYIKSTSVIKELRCNSFTSWSDLLILLSFMKSKFCCLHYFLKCLLIFLIFPLMSLKSILEMIEEKLNLELLDVSHTIFTIIWAFAK